MSTTTETRARDKVQLWDTDDLIAAIACTTRGSWLARIIANELVSRGIGHKGQWVGFEASRKLWADADAAPGFRPYWVSDRAARISGTHYERQGLIQFQGGEEYAEVWTDVIFEGEPRKVEDVHGWAPYSELWSDGFRYWLVAP